MGIDALALQERKIMTKVQIDNAVRSFIADYHDGVSHAVEGSAKYLLLADTWPTGRYIVCIFILFLKGLEDHMHIYTKRSYRA